MLTVNDLPKAAFHAFALLHEHDGGERVGVSLENAPVGLFGMASKTGRERHLLLGYYIEPEETACRPIRVDLSACGIGSCRLTAVRPGKGSAYETWVEIGRPDYVNTLILDRLTEAALPDSKELADVRDPVVIQPGTILQLSWLQEGDETGG